MLFLPERQDQKGRSEGIILPYTQYAGRFPYEASAGKHVCMHEGKNPKSAHLRNHRHAQECVGKSEKIIILVRKNYVELQDLIAML